MGPDSGPDDNGNGKGAEPADTAKIGIAFDLGVRLGVSVIIGLGGGLLLDSWLHTSPIFTLIGMVLGIGAAMYTIWHVAHDAMKK